LRPWPIERAVDYDAADAPGAQLLRLRREAKKGIDLAVNEELLRADRTAGDPFDLCLRVDADIPAITDRNRCSGPPTAWMPTFLPGRSATPRIPSLTNNSKQPT
jgi:hypothetical protein